MRRISTLFVAGHGPRVDAAQARKTVMGFTLIELIVTLSVAAILLALAIPSFTSAINQNRLASLGNDMLASLQGARMEAIRRNSRAVLCRSDDGASCAAGAQWNGWITFVDTNANGAVDGRDTVLQVGTVKPPLQMQVSSNIDNSEVVFRPDGLAYSAAGLLLQANVGVCIPTTLPAENTRVLGIASGSRFDIAPYDDGGNCSTPPNPP